MISSLKVSLVSAILFPLILLSSSLALAAETAPQQSEQEKIADQKLEASLKAIEESDSKKQVFTDDAPLAKKLYSKGYDFFKAGNYAEALEIFKEALLEDPTNLLTNYYIGKSAEKIGNYAEANFAFERALNLDPNHHLSRLEKARAHAHLGESLKAREEFDRVLEEDVPLAVKQNIELYLAERATGQEHTINYVLILSHAWDTNATLGTGPLIISIEPAITVDPTEQGDRILSSGLVIAHSYPLTYKKDLIWKNNFLLYTSDYIRMHALDLRLLQVGTGIEYSYLQNHQFAFNFNVMGLQIQEHLFQINPGIQIQYTYIYSPQFTMRAGATINHRHHFHGTGTPIENTFGLANNQTCGFNYLQDDKRTWDFNFTHSYDKSPKDGAVAASFHRYDFVLKYTQVLNERFKVSVGGTRRETKYRNLEPIEGIRRNDNTLIGTAGLTFNVTPTFFIDGVYTYTDNNSNLERGTYETTQVALNATYIF